MSVRYAVYYSPENTALGRFGARVLGTDIHRDAAAVEQFPLKALAAEDFKALTATARNYGFHATMKAPFRLSDGHTEADLIAVFREFCSAAAPADLPKTSVQNLHGFLAVMPASQPGALLHLEHRVVTEFDRFRAPLSPAEIERRRPDQLSERQRQHLSRYGYPFIMDDFHFHMTLTGRLTRGPVDMALHAELQDLYARLVPDADQTLDSLTLATQKSPSLPFTALATCSLG